MNPTPDTTAPIRFWRRGQLHTIDQPERHLTLLEWLRDARGLDACGTKEGCAEGDCGACTVVLAELDGSTDAPALRYRAINSCIRFVWQIDGMALWTVEDLAQERLHPCQQAMLEHHGSQCGFCTPGFVMSLFGLYQRSHAAAGAPAVSREQALSALSGNLCRCTGYRPILEAAQAMMQAPRVEQPEAGIIAALQALRSASSDPRGACGDQVFRPRDEQALLALRAALPQAQIIAGATDVGLWVTKMQRRFEAVIDVTAVDELRQIRLNGADGQTAWLEIGAAVRLQDAFEALCAARPQLAAFAHRFAGLPVRQSGTLGGNIANGSPIGDSMPLLIALGARVRLSSAARGARELALEDLYLAYRKTALAPDEVLTQVLVPQPSPDEICRVYKLSKRFEDDISAVCLAINISLDAGQRITRVRIGVGGMAATPMRARQCEAALLGQVFAEATVLAAAAVLEDEFTPLSDMRASARYRRLACGRLLQRFWREVNDPAGLHSLESLTLRPLPLDGEGARA